VIPTIIYLKLLFYALIFIFIRRAKTMRRTDSEAISNRRRKP
jgi:hypothetical protein